MFLQIDRGLEHMPGCTSIYRRLLHGAAVAALMSVVTFAQAFAAEVKIAVAANFTAPAKEIVQLFETATGHKMLLSFGSTGQFFAQISKGAPFDILLAADKDTPAKLVAQGLGDGSTQFTYAVGRLVLYSQNAKLVNGEATLKDATFAKIAIANPATAPYGAAAVQVMTALGVYDQLAPKLVQGNNIGQTFQFVDTGNADVGFVALSQIALTRGGSRWVVPDKLHAPIAQDAVLLKPGADNAAAMAFLAFLKGPAARTVIEKFGYGASQ